MLDDIVVTHDLGHGIRIVYSNIYFSGTFYELESMGVFRVSGDGFYNFNVDTSLLDERSLTISRQKESIESVNKILEQDPSNTYMLSVAPIAGPSIQIMVNDELNIDQVIDLIYDYEDIQRNMFKLRIGSHILEDLSVTLGELKAIGLLDRIEPKLRFDYKPNNGYRYILGG